MRYLLDTNALYGSVFDTQFLSRRAREVIEEKRYLGVSIVSIWEIAIKQSIGKLQLSVPAEYLFDICAGLEIDIENIGKADIETVRNLPLHHRDPFDRMIVVQAMNRGCTIVTSDQTIPQYDVATIW